MKVVISIEGQEAIPVRALPYMVPALTPRRIAADLGWTPPLGWGLSPDSEHREPLAGTPSYHLQDGHPEKIPPIHWRRFERTIGQWHNTTHGPDDSEYRNTIRLLPAGVFIWKGDFELYFEGKIPVPPGVETPPPVRNAWYTPLISEDMQQVVMDGFERYVRNGAGEATPAPSAETGIPKAASEYHQPPDATEKGNRIRAMLTKIVNALERYADEAGEPFDPKAMPGPLGSGWKDEGSFHWLCGEIDRAFRRAPTTFEKHRAGICAVQKYAQPTDFYRHALPRIAPIFLNAERGQRNK